MIKELSLKCFECAGSFVAKDKIFYREDFTTQNFADMKLICYDCLNKWQEHWQIKSAEFHEEYGAIYAKIELIDGTVIERTDCTVIDDIVVINQDTPLEMQKHLFAVYKVWHDEKMKDCIKSCLFDESFMHTSFTCETYGGQRYENVAFRFNRLGTLETEASIPDIIKEQIAVAWNNYELANMPIPDLKTQK